MDHLETEVKFYLSDMNFIRNRIIGLGADNKGRVFETNIRFDDDNKNLLRNHSLLRLRNHSKTTLTFKSAPNDLEDNQFKIFRELEVEVSSFSTMKRILKSLGFNQEQIYEKWRETFLLKDTMLCLDTMPYGNFLEIEASKEQIKHTASQLGFRWEKRIILNYLVIFDIIRTRSNLLFYDVTFSNFKNINLNLAEYLNDIEVGTA